MKICLISPPTVTEFSERDFAESEARRLIAQHAPIGILSLAGILEEYGILPDIVDLNQLYYKFVHSDECRTIEFCNYAGDVLQNISADIFGFSSICSSYPLTLRLAQQVRIKRPDAWIILGGPQASVVDVATLRNFPSVDLVVRGEAERTLPLVLDAISRNATGLKKINGVTFRQGDEVIRNPNACVIEDLDSLPFPAFHLYPPMKDCTYAPIEAGRGCPFACSFCSTNDFFRRRFRLKSPEILVSQMRHVKETYGIESFDLIHDMFTVDRRKVVGFCDAIDKSGEELYWSCSARTDCIDDELISRMKQAGCNGIFFGIDTGSERMQKIIHKRLNLDDARLRIECSNRHGIRTAVSLIIGFPEETKNDLRATVDLLGDSLRHRHAQPQFHFLAPLAETPITTEYKDQLIFDEIFSDMSFQGWEQDPEDREMIKAYPDIFTNFYAVPTQSLDRKYLRELREFILRGTLRHRWLMVLLHRDAGNLMDVFEAWQFWSERERNFGGIVDTNKQYYKSDAFSRDFLIFVMTEYKPRVAKYPHLIETMVTVDRAQLNLNKSQFRIHHPRQADGGSPSDFVSMDAIPILAEGRRLVLVSSDYSRLVRCLKKKERLDTIPPEQTALVLLNNGEKIKIIQLNRQTYELLCFCDGTRTISDIIRDFSLEAPFGISTTKAALFGLASLVEKGFVNVTKSSQQASLAAQVGQLH